jgi:hypothetical protein
MFRDIAHTAQSTPVMPRSMDWLQARAGLTQSGTVRLVDRLTDAPLLRRAHPPGVAFRCI